MMDAGATGWEQRWSVTPEFGDDFLRMSRFDWGGGTNREEGRDWQVPFRVSKKEKEKCLVGRMRGKAEEVVGRKW